jgi:5'-3' exonuclease
VTAKPARLHVVDGTFELYRAHFSQRPGHNAPDGQDVKATVGLLSSMLTLLQDAEEAVTHVAVAFDNPIVSFRNALFDGYKTDAGVPPELRAQFDLVEDGCRALGLATWSMNELEADDALASAAAQYADQVGQVRLLTPDKDLAQCLVGERVVCVDRIRKSVKTEATAQEQLGFPVRLVADHLALVGDTADGIPGVPGIGAKTSATLLATFGGLDGIPADPHAWPKGIRGADRLAASLNGMRDQARLYRTLATVRTDAVLPKDVAALRWLGVPGPAWQTFCARVGISRMAPAVHRFV